MERMERQEMGRERGEEEEVEIRGWRGGGWKEGREQREGMGRRGEERHPPKGEENKVSLLDVSHQTNSRPSTPSPEIACPPWVKVETPTCLRVPITVALAIDLLWSSNCLSVAVRHGSLYSGLSGFNGALGCMSVGGLFFTFSWRSHLFAIATAFLCSYVDIAFSNLLGTIGLPACSWAATLVVTLMLLLTGRGIAAYRIPIGQVRSPEHNLSSRSQWKAGNTLDPDSTVV
ncbi:unnamed protein product [Arctogadus glacialis]